MSVVGSLGLEHHYDHNNDSFLNMTDASSTHQCGGSNLNATISTVTGNNNNTTIMTAKSNINATTSSVGTVGAPPVMTVPHKRIHFNRLWSVWYGILVTLLQGYLIVQGFHKYLGCSLLTWKNGLPSTELNMQLIFCGLTLLFLPLFLASALFKVGNLANDGVKLTSRKGTCSSEPQHIFDDEPNSNTLKSIWIHGCPISVFIHIITALCLLLPHLLLETKLIQNGHLPKENIWTTEIDFMVKRTDRQVILNFVPSNSAAHHNDTLDYNMNKFDDSIEEIDYDLDTFETHESLQSQRPILINGQSTFAYIPSVTTPTYEYYTTHSSYDLRTLKSSTSTTTMKTTTTTTTTTTEPPTTTTTTSTTTETTPTTTTTETTVTEPPTTMPTTKSTTLTTTTTELTTPITTTKLLKPISSTVFTTTSAEIVAVAETTRFIPDQQQITQENVMITNQESNTNNNLNKKAKDNDDFDIFNLDNFSAYSNNNNNNNNRNNNNSNNRNRNNHKNRKHNHKNKQQHKHEHFFSESDDVEEVNKNLELRPEKEFDFDVFDREVHLIDSSKGKKKHKSSGRVASTEERDRQKAMKGRQREKERERYVDRNSDIHIVRTEKIPEASIPSTTVTTNSKIIEIKGTTGNKTNKRIVKRYTDDLYYNDRNVLVMEGDPPSISEDDLIIKNIEPEKIPPAQQLIGTVPNFTKSQEMHGMQKFLHNILGDTGKFEPKHWYSNAPSLEFLNLVLALLVWSVRYPSVFWETSKAFTIIFSLQMVANSLDILMLYAGTSILFKLQAVGQYMLLQQQQSPLLLNGIVTLALTLLAYVLIISSSMILYLYGHSRLSAKIRDCHLITMKGGDAWSYFSHCASLCFILALSVVKAPIIHDLSVTYRVSLDGTVFATTIASIIHIFLWIFVWFGLTVKRRWSFKLPAPDANTIYQSRAEVIQPLITQNNRQYNNQNNLNSSKKETEETIYWPSSPKLKVTFSNDVPSTLSDHNIVEHDGKRIVGASIRSSSTAGEIDEGEYATLKTELHISEYDEVINLQQIVQQNVGNDGCDDNISEEGKLLECVRDDKVTYASTKGLEPPQTSVSTFMQHSTYATASECMISPLAPVQVHTVHTSEVHVTTSTPRFLRRADSGMPPTNEALTPKSDTTSTESSTTSPPERGERALSESSGTSGVHSSEENKDEVVIRRPTTAPKSIIKPTPAVIHEEPFGRSTNMKMSSFKDGNTNCNTLPLRSNSTECPPIVDYSQCNTMPLPPNLHQIHRMSASDQKRTTLPNNIRYSSAGQYLRQMPQMKNSESPYGTCGLGSGHHTFSKLIHNDVTTSNPIISSSQSQQQFNNVPMAQQQQPMHQYQTSSSSSFSTFNHPLPPPPITSNYAIVTDHSYNNINNNNDNLYTQNTLQMH